MKLFRSLFESRKSQALLVLIVVVTLGSRVGLEQEQVVLTAEGLMAFILGRAIHDHALSKS